MARNKIPMQAPGRYRRGHVIPGNGHPLLAWAFEADRQSIQAASLGMATNSFSPMSAGVHAGDGGTPRGYTGLPGFGMNGNRDSTRTGPLQVFSSAVRPITNPERRSLGMGAGVAGQPGMPSTGNAGGLPGYMGLGQLGPGYGG